MLAGRTRRLCDRQDVRKQVLDSWADSAVEKTLNDSLLVQKHAKKMQRRSHTFRFRRAMRVDCLGPGQNRVTCGSYGPELRQQQLQ